MSESDHHRGDLLPAWMPRLLAGLLALGGSWWGLLLSPWLFRPEASPVGWLIFGPGYLVTLGYIIRTINTPPIGVRRLIWVSSLLVQGAWLLWLIWSVAEQVSAGRSVNESGLMAAWWVFATVASVIGLLAERPMSAASRAAPDRGGM